MKFKQLHEWDLSVEEAKSVQRLLANQISLKNQFSKIRFIAGADISIDTNTGEGIAGIIVYTFPELETVEKKHARKKITYPYIPGLLSFRESPILLEAVKKIETEPDLFIFDGQGIAHPRTLGIATHMGLLLDKPTIGCAKSRLFGKYEEPNRKAGSISPLMNGNREIGAVVRTRENVKPVFVSPGHKIDLESSVRIILQCCDGLRIPKPTREADHFVNLIKRGQLV